MILEDLDLVLTDTGVTLTGHKLLQYTQHSLEISLKGVPLPTWKSLKGSNTFRGQPPRVEPGSATTHPSTQPEVLNTRGFTVAGKHPSMSFPINELLQKAVVELPSRGGRFDDTGREGVHEVC